MISYFTVVGETDFDTGRSRQRERGPTSLTKLAHSNSRPYFVCGKQGLKKIQTRSRPRTDRRGDGEDRGGRRQRGDSARHMGAIPKNGNVKPGAPAARPGGETPEAR